jgi:hypothetical protein
MKLFQQLGADIEQRWRDKNYDEEIFPAIAEQSLIEADLPGKVSAWEVISWSLRETVLPEQRDLAGKFGDPPITLYNSPRFHIDVYFWLDGTTSIHQHGFCGAFQVLHGSSIHSSYNFELAESINMFTEIGEIRLQNCELLKVGDTRRILAGRDFIHSLFHLDRPSATIVVRTYRSPLHLPQFDYKKPFLAIDPFFEEPTTVKKLQSLSALLRIRHPETDKLISELLESADFQTTFTILSNVRDHLNSNHLDQFFNPSGTQDRFEKFLEIARKRHGSPTEIFPKIFRHSDKLNEIVRRRSFITNSDHRFFLALMLNVEGKERIFSLIKNRFPETDPAEKILDWTDELANTKVFGTNLPNALGIADFDNFDLFALETILKDLSEAETREKLQTEYGMEPTAEVMRNLAAKTEKIRQAVIFEPLFS